MNDSLSQLTQLINLVKSRDLLESRDLSNVIQLSQMGLKTHNSIVSCYIGHAINLNHVT